jgi:folylpolyglutamate synthase/dihydropteroate synthase
VQTLRERVATSIEPLRLRSSAGMADALAAARQEAGSGGRVLVFGSFHTVGEAMQLLQPTAG